MKTISNQSFSQYDICVCICVDVLIINVLDARGCSREGGGGAFLPGEGQCCLGASDWGVIHAYIAASDRESFMPRRQ